LGGVFCGVEWMYEMFPWGVMTAVDPGSKDGAGEMAMICPCEVAVRVALLGNQGGVEGPGGVPRELMMVCSAGVGARGGEGDHSEL
jgi:hypothetical protein